MVAWPSQKRPLKYRKTPQAHSIAVAKEKGYQDKIAGGYTFMGSLAAPVIAEIFQKLLIFVFDPLIHSGVFDGEGTLLGNCIRIVYFLF